MSQPQRTIDDLPPVAKIATMADIYLKVMVWGEPGAGKTRFALSFPDPLLIDLEKGSKFYANQFRFYVAEPTPDLSGVQLVNVVLHQLGKGIYPGVRTLIIDPVTDYIDQLEIVVSQQVMREKKLDPANLRGPQKAGFYAAVRDGIRARLDNILRQEVNIVWVARAKNKWGKEDGEIKPVGRAADAPEILDYLTDLVLQMNRNGHTEVIKSRVHNLPAAIKAPTYADLARALSAPPPTVDVEAPVAAPAPSPAPALLQPTPPPAPAPPVDKPTEQAPDIRTQFANAMKAAGVTQQEFWGKVSGLVGRPVKRWADVSETDLAAALDLLLNPPDEDDAFAPADPAPQPAAPQPQPQRPPVQPPAVDMSKLNI